MNNPTDEQIGAAMGRLFKKYKSDKKWAPIEEDNMAHGFLISLIPVEKVWNAKNLKYGYIYYFIDSDCTGALYCPKKVWEDQEVDFWNRENEICFPTREAAEAYKAEKLKQLD